MTLQIKTGFLLINKPTGITSYGCIGYLKRIIRQKIKIGHAGTLDPFACGLLVIAFGREATRLLLRIMTLEKTYCAKAKLGELTDTLDYTGSIIETTDPSAITEVDIVQAIQSFGSSYAQTPPLYSALKHQGDPLYRLARSNIMSAQELTEIAQKKSKTVQLYSFELIEAQLPFFTVRARVSQGTYIRSLVNDLAARLHSCATTYELERSSIGSWTISDAVGLDALNSIEDINAHIIDVYIVQK